MKVFYDEGYQEQSFGIAGEFRMGEPRDIPDDLAEVLIKKGRLKKWTGGGAESAPSDTK